MEQLLLTIVIQEDLLKTLTKSLVVSHLTYFVVGGLHCPNNHYNVVTESGMSVFVEVTKKSL